MHRPEKRLAVSIYNIFVTLIVIIAFIIMLGVLIRVLLCIRVKKLDGMQVGSDHDSFPYPVVVFTYNETPEQATARRRLYGLPE